MGIESRRYPRFFSAKKDFFFIVDSVGNKYTNHPMVIVFQAVLLIIACLTLWYAHAVFLLGFSAILFAIFLTTVSKKICQIIKIPYTISLSLLLLVLIGLLTLVFWISTPLVTAQLNALFEQLPQALDKSIKKLGPYFDWKLPNKAALTSEIILSNKFFQQAGAVFTFTATTVTGLVVFLMVGVYLAYAPDKYVTGFMYLFPSRKEHAERAMSELGKALRWWLFGKFISMATIGLLTMLGLWILQIPLAFILGLLAGLLAFIPYIGAILASIPAILIALSLSFWDALYVTILFLCIHALDGYFITPTIEQKTVSLPPALTVMCQILFTLLLGFLGLALATPLVVVFLVLIREIYIKPATLKTTY